MQRSRTFYCWFLNLLTAEMRVKKIPHIRRCNNSLHSHVRNHLIVTHTFILILYYLVLSTSLLLSRPLHHTRSLNIFFLFLALTRLNVFIHISKLSWWLILFIVTIVRCTLTDLHVLTIRSAEDDHDETTIYVLEMETHLSGQYSCTTELRKWEFEGAFRIPRRFYNYLSQA